MPRRRPLAVLAPIALLAQSQLMKISVKRQERGVWRAIDPGLVLGQGDLAPFRFGSTFDGYLYVINSGGQQSLLFPGDSAGVDNCVQAERDYFVPSIGAPFRSAGPQGHNGVYWLISPAPPDGRPANPCIDSPSGPRNATAEEQLPRAPNLKRRELIIVQEKDKSRVSAPGKLAGPVIHEFRLAHN